MPPAAAAEISPPTPAADGETMPETADAGVTAGVESDGGKEMVPEEATALKPDAAEEPEEEDPEEAEEGTEEARAAAGGDAAAAVAESGVVREEAGDGDTALEVAITDGGDHETRVEPPVEVPKEMAVAMAISDGGNRKTGVEPVDEEEPNDVMEAADEEPIEMDDEEPEEEPEEVVEDAEEPDNEEPEELELEEEGPADKDAEEGDEEDEPMEEATNVSEEEAMVEDMNEIADKDSEEAQDEDKHGDSDKDEVADRLSNDEEAGLENDELDTSSRVLDSVPDGNDKTLELFVGGLPKDCVEEDIRVVFSQCGEIESIRIMKTSGTKRKKGFAFLCYADVNAAKKALAEFKDGIKVKGIEVRVSVADPHRKSSKKALMKYIWNIFLALGMRAELKNAAKDMGVFKMKSALACIEGINNAEISDGEVKLAASLARPPCKVQLANESSMGGLKVHTSSTPKSPDKSKMKKDHRDEIAVKKPQRKLLKGDESKLPYQDDVEVPQISTLSKGKAKVRKHQNTSFDEKPSKKARKNGDESKLPSQDEGKDGKRKNTSVNERPLKKAWKNRKLPSQGDLEEPETSNHSKGKRRVRKSKNTTVNEIPAEKAWRNRNMKYPAGSRYATNNQAYPSVGATSKSKLHAHDLEPHAGFIPPSNRVQRTRAHDRQRTAPYNIHHSSGFSYARERIAPQPAYSVHTSNAAGVERRVQ
uniref:RRM domain-containing protein n=1 Tax=Leersia perrieri TaxID=77586 RepID=A0A0D9XI40_9ORYZ